MKQEAEFSDADTDLQGAASVNAGEAEMLDEYELEGREMVRGKYAHVYADRPSDTFLDPDVAEVFPTRQSVNEALRLLIRLARQQVGTPRA
jgi:hypothetical protein